VRKFEQEPSAPEAKLPREEPGVGPETGIEEGTIAERVSEFKQEPSTAETGEF
jgi:hypothetical protein